ncbi:MAG: DUF177 domain-containing protein [Tannerella sp.]|nr:DUF177 domain-containing protein [Tannerella sp.]
MEAYKIDLKALPEGEHRFEYLLDDDFFAEVDGPELRKGKVKVSLALKKGARMAELQFHIEGTVCVPCDRCLEEMEVPVASDNRLVLKPGKEYAEESDEIVVIPEEEDAINLSWYLYEFVALDIPMKHVHPAGLCDPEMSEQLRLHGVRSASSEEEENFPESEEREGEL